MAEFSVVSQALKAVDPRHGTVVEELRTLQVKRSVVSIQRMRERAAWQKFGKAKGNVGRITDVLKDDIVIEPPSGLWGTEEDDKIAHHFVAATGKMNITLSTREGGNTPTPSHSRRNSGQLPDDTVGDYAKAKQPRSRSGSINSGGDSPLPQAPKSDA